MLPNDSFLQAFNLVSSGLPRQQRSPRQSLESKPSQQSDSRCGGEPEGHYLNYFMSELSQPGWTFASGQEFDLDYRFFHGRSTANGSLRASPSSHHATARETFFVARSVPVTFPPPLAATRRESGSKLAALQTLRECGGAPAGAKRLDCVRLAGAFPAVREGHNSEVPSSQTDHGGYFSCFSMLAQLASRPL